MDSIGFKHNTETKKKMSKSRKGCIPWNKGVPCSKETKEKISKTKTGSVQSEESNLKRSLTQKGRVFSEESKKKISDSLKKDYARKRELGIEKVAWNSPLKKN
jgi:hypothetical protein